MNRCLCSLVGLFIWLSVVSCKKEKDNSVPGSQCKMTSAEVKNSSSWIVTNYIYTGDKITLEKRYNYDVKLTYTGDNITQRDYLLNSGYDKLFYNADGTISNTESYFNNGTSSLLYRVSEFAYSSGKLVSQIVKFDTSSNPPKPLVILAQYNYTYTGNNITSCVFKDFIKDSTFIFNYQYDNLSNIFSKRKTNLITDPLFSGFVGDLLPLRLSENNVIKLQQYGQDNNLSYVLDDKQNLKEILVNGVVFYRYTYQCQ